MRPTMSTIRARAGGVFKYSATWGSIPRWRISARVLREVLRQKGTPYAELGLDDESLSDDQLLDAVEAHPVLLNRPIVVTPAGVKLCRPSEAVLDLLPGVALKPFVKEDGEVIIDEAGNRVR